MKVGISDRTPAKHAVMRRVIGQQVGAFPWVMDTLRVQGMIIVDATAGNGRLLGKGAPIDEFSTPHMMARQLAWAKGNWRRSAEIAVHLIDRDPGCVAQLREDINIGTGLTVHEGDSRAIVPTLSRSDHLVVYIDDPNHSGSSTLDHNVVAWLTEDEAPCTIFAAIGANVAGMARLPGHYEESLARYENLLFMARSSRSRFPRVPILCRLHADASRWGYLTIGSARFAESVQNAYVKCMSELTLHNGPYPFHAEPRICIGYDDVSRGLEEQFTRRSKE